ncbi:hypothetical protein ACJX0J_028887, partial [Zea mays]
KVLINFVGINNKMNIKFFLVSSKKIILTKKNTSIIKYSYLKKRKRGEIFQRTLGERIAGSKMDELTLRHFSWVFEKARQHSKSSMYIAMLSKDDTYRGDEINAHTHCLLHAFFILYIY